MFFHVDSHNGLAIYEQIARQIKFAVAGGLLQPGQLAPSVRELAKELTINPNTIARAYRQLQDEGVLVAVRGTGLEVAPGAPEHCRQQRLELLRKRLRQTLTEARQSRLSYEEICSLVEQELSALKRED
jgi:GntR family transcriptional regulator